MRKIYKTKTGQPYIKLKSGKAKFIKRTAVKRTRKSKTRVNPVRRKKMAKKKKSYGRSKGLLGNLNTPLTGAAGVVVYESLISPMIPLQGTAKDMLELIGGLYLSKKRGIIGATGKSLVVLNSYQLINGLIGNKLQGLIGNTPSSSYNYNGGY